MTSTPANFAARAALLTSRNIPVVPVAAGEKACKLPNWPTLATTNSAQIDVWDAQADYNTAAVCRPDGICVLDSDSPELAAQIAQLLPQTFTTQSAGKRLPHYYFLQTDVSRALGNCSAKGLFDFQQNRKYVVGPGSVLADGRTYDVINDSPIVPIPDALVEWIAEKATNVEKKAFTSSQVVAESFDLDELMEHYGITGDYDGNWFITDVCPISGRKHQQSTRTGFYFDGEHLGWKCFASGCDGSDMSVGQVLSHLNKTHTTYTGEIWPSEPDMMVGTVIYRDQADYEAAKAAYQAAKAAKAAKPRFRGPRSVNAESAFDFMIEPLPGQTDGWFPLGEVSLVGGASGGGKTTLMLDWLEKQSKREFVMSRITNGRSHVSLLADRGTNALKRTAQRMRLDLDTLPYALLKPGGDVVDRIDAEIVKAGTPEVVFVEGVDMLTGDPSNPEVVGQFLDELGALAEHYHIAVIGSIGSPKMTAKNGYISTRDKIIGSTIWGRKVETIVYLNREAGKETDDITLLTVLPRNAPPEEHKMRLIGGRLQVFTPREQESAQMSSNEIAMLDWIKDQETFTRSECKKKFTSMNGTKLTERLEGFQKAGLIKQRTKGAKVWYEVPANLTQGTQSAI